MGQNFGEYLRTLMGGMSPKAFALKVGISYSTVQAYLNGTRGLGPKVCALLQEAFPGEKDILVGFLLSGKYDKTNAS